MENKISEPIFSFKKPYFRIRAFTSFIYFVFFGLASINFNTYLFDYFDALNNSLRPIFALTLFAVVGYFYLKFNHWLTKKDSKVVYAFLLLISILYAWVYFF